MIGFHHHSIHLIQVGCKKLMAITLRHCVAYAEKLLILVIWVIGPYSVMSRVKTIKKCEEYESTATNECFF